jgi:hypothetical protein
VRRKTVPFYIHGFWLFELPAKKISIVPGQTPNVLGEELVWCEVDTSEVEYFYLNLQLKDSFRIKVSKNFYDKKDIFISTEFCEDSVLLA